MEIHNPPRPGEVIRELCLEPLEISVTAAARALGVTRKALSELLNGRSGVSPAMALRLAKAFDTTAGAGSTFSSNMICGRHGEPYR